LLDKADLLLSALEYKSEQKAQSNEEKFQLTACRTNWYLASSINIKKSRSIYDVKYNSLIDNAYKTPNTLRNYKDLAYYVLKFSTLVAVIDDLNNANCEIIKKYQAEIIALIDEYKSNNSWLGASLLSNRSIYFEKNQALGFIYSSIACLANRMEFDNISVEYKDSSYFKEAIKQFGKGATKSVRYVDNNIIATENSLALYYKQIAQKSLFNGKDFNDNKEKAIATIKRVINANKNDGNLYDTYAEILFDLNGRKSSNEFCESIKNALNHPNVFDGITFNNYKGDIRWRENDDFKKIIAEFEKKQESSLKEQFISKVDSKNKVKSSSHMADTQNDNSSDIILSSKSNSKF
jgi:hypothetical protein